MESFLPFFIILFASLSFGVIFEKIHLPWVVALILAGIFIGPNGLHLIQKTDTIQFLGEVGLVFVMFLAGLETKLGDIKKFQTAILSLSFLNGFLPFLVGYLIAFLLGYNPTTALLTGIIFISSSIAIVVPTLESQKILQTKLGQAIMSTSILQDIASLILLSLFLQTEKPIANLPLWLFYPLLLIILGILKSILPHLEEALAHLSPESDNFQDQVRSVFFVLFGTVIIFELLGLHPIIAGFFAGFVLADSLESDKLKQKLRAIGYGVFVPTFFVVVGMDTNLAVFFQTQYGIAIILTIIAGSVLSKLISGTAAAKLVGFNNNQSLLFGVSSVPQLSTTLAAAFSARALGLIEEPLFNAFIILSVVTTLVGPTLMSLTISQVVKDKDLHHTHT